MVSHELHIALTPVWRLSSDMGNWHKHHVGKWPSLVDMADTRDDLLDSDVRSWNGLDWK